MYKRVLVLAAAVFLGVATAVLMVLYFGLHQVRQTELAIAQEVMRNGWLSSVVETAVYSGEKEYRVAKGIDSQGQEKWIWYSDNERYETLATGLLSADEAIRKAQQRYPESRIVRVLPGLFKQRPVWEVFLQEKANDHYIYLYLQMTDGTVIRELKLF